ncbi:MAG: PLP-dependent aminotransferase family protein [Thermoanaerobaculia bacterium]
MQDARHGVVPVVIAIDRDSPQPLYRQIYEGYREAIVDGRLHGGERLPSTRDLAAELGVSRFPILNAFEQLVAEGYCEAQTGAGTFVAASLPEAVAPSRTTNGLAPRTPSSGPRELASGPAADVSSPPPWLAGPGPLTIGGTAVDEFPLRVWATLLTRRARDISPELLHYGPRHGLQSFREAIAAYLRASRGVLCEPDQVMVVSGSQQALALAARLLLDPSRPVWIEEPGYWGARDAFTLAGARLVPVPVDEEGLNVAEGVARCPRAHAVYVTPSHQFPLGVTMSASRRMQLLDWAQRTGAWIIEDDYNSEFRYESLPIAALQGLDRDARVIYIGTFSKVLSPGLRIGYLVLPPDLVDRFGLLRWTADISPPTFLQAVLTDFLNEGHFARHLRRMRKLYRERRSALVDAIRDLPGEGITVLGDRAGLHLVATLPASLRDVEVAARALEEGVKVLPLSTCYLGPDHRQGLVLGYGGTRADEIPSAVRRLARAL